MMIEVGIYFVGIDDLQFFEEECWVVWEFEKIVVVGFVVVVVVFGFF